MKNVKKKKTEKK